MQIPQSSGVVWCLETWGVPAGGAAVASGGGRGSPSFADHIRAILARHGVRADGPDGISLDDETVQALDESLEAAITQALDGTLARYGISSYAV